MNIDKILADHVSWLGDAPGGVRANLSGANLSGADLHWANLCWANLCWANLSGADLSGADLTKADLIEANLIEANLSGADLRWANLRWANLSGANLRGADLREANLIEANLSGVDLRWANLRWANLSGANLRGAELPKGIPVIEDIHKAVYEAASQDGALNMSTWHTCETTHCRAGWVVFLAGEDGRKLEIAMGANAAAALIYMASDPGLERVPDFYTSNADAIEDMKQLAGKYEEVVPCEAEEND
jgi:hypothetical protein